MSAIASAADATLVPALRALLERRTGRPVALVETHISWVLLTDRLALKLKKPVHLAFLDFSTPALRRHFCHEELRLNRRLAADLYRAVLAVRGSVDAPRLGSEGEPIDWLLCMRRFPDGALLSQRLAAGRLAPEDLDRLAQRIAKFHAAAPVARADGPFGTPPCIAQAGRAVARQLAQLGAAPAGIEGWIKSQAQALYEPWRRRLASGFVREVHGDLHLSNVLVRGADVTAFDCVEFDPVLRWIDVMSDVAFLTMDLRAHGRADLAWCFLDAYLQASGDYEGLGVLRFYEVYRALVRALVGEIARRDGVPQAARPVDYRGCAQRWVAEAPRKPRLAILFGLSGSGKSTLALELLQVAGAVRVRSDVERKRLFGLTALQRSDTGRHDMYTADATRSTYDRLAACARHVLRAGYSVLVDAAFLLHAERQAFAALAREEGVAFTVIACEARPAVLRQRVVARAAGGGDASEADLAVLERQMRLHEPLSRAERRAAIVVPTDRLVDVASLARRWLGC